MKRAFLQKLESIFLKITNGLLDILTFFPSRVSTEIWIENEFEKKRTVLWLERNYVLDLELSGTEEKNEKV